MIDELNTCIKKQGMNTFLKFFFFLSFLRQFKFFQYLSLFVYTCALSHRIQNKTRLRLQHHYDILPHRHLDKLWCSMLVPNSMKKKVQKCRLWLKTSTWYWKRLHANLFSVWLWSLSNHDVAVSEYWYFLPKTFLNIRVLQIPRQYDQHGQWTSRNVLRRYGLQWKWPQWFTTIGHMKNVQWCYFVFA